MTCIGKDPRCPCQDGDACHYKDCGGTKAWPVPKAEPLSEWLLIKNILDEYGLDAISFVAEWKAAQQQAEPVAWNAGVAPMWPQQKEGETFLVSYTTPTQPEQQAEPPQRPWVGLTDEEIRAVNAQVSRIPPIDYTTFTYARAVETKLKERNGY